MVRLDHGTVMELRGKAPGGAMVRANRIWKAALEEYEAPAIDLAIAEELREFVATRKSDIM